MAFRVLLVGGSRSSQHLATREIRRRHAATIITRADDADAAGDAMADQPIDAVVVSDTHADQLTGICSQAARAPATFVLGEKNGALQAASASTHIRIEPGPGRFRRLADAVDAVRTRGNGRDSPTQPLYAIDALEQLDSAVVLFDRHDRFVYANRLYYTIFADIADLLRPGSSFEEILVNAIERGSMRIPEGESAQAWMDQRIAQHQICRGAMEQQFKDGRWMLVHDHPTADGGRICVRTDITELKQAYQALERERQFFGRIVDELPAMISVKDRDFRYTLINQRTAQLLGTTVEEARGRRVQEFLGDGNSKKVHPYDLKVLTEGCTATFDEEVSIRGEQFHWHTTKTPLRNDAGEIERILSVWIDVTEQKRLVQQLRDNEARLREFATIASDWFWETNDELRLSYVSIPDGGTEAGINIEASLGSLPWHVGGVDPINNENWSVLSQSLQAHQPIRDLMLRYLTRGGRTRHIRVNAQPINDAAGVFKGYRGTARDITESIRSNQRIADYERRVAAIADNLPGMIFERRMTPDGRLHYPFFAGAEKHLSAMPIDELENPEADALEPMHPDDRDIQRARIEQSARTLEPFSAEFRIVDRDGRIMWIWQSNRPRRDADGTVVWDCMEIDISERKVVEERARYLALFDETTGLPNRNLFNDRAVLAIANARRDKELVAITVLGLRRFSDINAAHGLKAGDHVLRLVGEKIESCLAAGDSIARVGGDRFGLLLTGLEQTRDAIPRLQAVFDTLRQPIVAAGTTIHVSASAGIALYPEDGGDFTTLLTAAESAYIDARAQGPGRFAFANSERNRLAHTHAILGAGLHTALDHGQLAPWFQPIVCATDRSLRGCEALARWQHPSRGLMGAGEFIDVAADSGLLARLDDHILRSVCRTIAAWTAANLAPVPVSINVSADQFDDRGFSQRLLDIAGETGVDPALLMIEITERTLVSNTEHVTQMMARLSQAGVRFAVDDFGIGYSALSYLPKLPISVLKLDRVFVAGIAGNAAHSAIVQAIVAMARSLRLRVVAEGVETEEEALFLKAYQCDQLQGFLTGRPMPADEFARLLDPPSG